MFLPKLARYSVCLCINNYLVVKLTLSTSRSAFAFFSAFAASFIVVRTAVFVLADSGNSEISCYINIICSIEVFNTNYTIGSVT